MRIRTFGASALVAGLCMIFASTSSFAARPTTVRGQLVHKIVSKWGAHVHEAYKADVGAWARAMTPLMVKADMRTLQKAADARTFEAMNNTLLGASAPKTSAAGIVKSQSLGESAADLVLIPIEPCRLFDTRLAGGPIAANTSRDFDVTAVGNYTFQGGAATDCGVGGMGSFAAAVINFTVVTPAAAGFITAYPYGTTMPLAATVNYAGGDIKGNLSVVKLDQSAAANELSIYSYKQAHVVGDIVGYFIAPSPTPLECVETANSSTVMAAGAVANVGAQLCSAGYVETATNCFSDSWNMMIVYQRGGTCSGHNTGGTSAELHATRTCCRVPGR